MRLEAITICVDYADFLAHIMPQNRPHFDRWIVVTSPEDTRTQGLCEHYHIECIKTNVFTEDGATFRKSAGINAALKRVTPGAWVAHIDADIVLPPRSREILKHLDLDPRCIYGIDRMMCPTFDAWVRYLSAPEIQHRHSIFVNFTAFELGARLAKLYPDPGMPWGDGYAPVGYFQLWNPTESGRSEYPDHSAADHSDHAFARLWPRNERILIPEIAAIHLGQSGQNWNGRKTAHFGPVPVEVAKPVLPSREQEIDLADLFE